MKTDHSPRRQHDSRPSFVVEPQLDAKIEHGRENAHPGPLCWYSSCRRPQGPVSRRAHRGLNLNWSSCDESAFTETVRELCRPFRAKPEEKTLTTGCAPTAMRSPLHPWLKTDAPSELCWPWRHWRLRRLCKSEILTRIPGQRPSLSMAHDAISNCASSAADESELTSRAPATIRNRGGDVFLNQWGWRKGSRPVATRIT